MSSVIASITSKSVINASIHFGVHVITSCGNGVEMNVIIGDEYFQSPEGINEAIKVEILAFLSYHHGITVNAGEHITLLGGVT